MYSSTHLRSVCLRSARISRFHRRQIGVDGFLEQLALFRQPVFGLDAEAPTLVQRQFVGQLIDSGLAPVQLLSLSLTVHPAQSASGLARHLCRQLLRQLAQFIGTELIEMGGQGHG